MKLSDFVAEYLSQINITHIFAISGGASLHLMHSIAENTKLELVCPQHEQGGAYAADGYARVTGGYGCAIATSGPGATNLITGIASSYYDSVPVIYITGQVASFRSKGDTGVRQMGFQETDMVDLCRTITKYSVLITDPYMIKYELQKASYIATFGRPGPVLIDIPDDYQRLDIDPKLLIEFIPPSENKEKRSNAWLETVIQNCILEIKKARRPVLILGWGVHLSGAEKKALFFAEKMNIPVVMTWGARDIVPNTHPLYAGGFGTHGTRYANFTVQNSDLVISIGSRLDTKATGTPQNTFAREAKIIMVDIDETEIKKFNKLDKVIDIEVPLDAKFFLDEIIKKCSFVNKNTEWLKTVENWKHKYPQCLDKFKEEIKINPYWFVHELSQLCNNDDVLFSDTGCSVAWLMQSFEFKDGQRFFHAFNNTPMGYGVPGAIGASFARERKQVICVVGDGALLMTIQELATAVFHKLPIKIILMNNYGHAMVRQTQDMWLDGNYYGTSENGGLPMPDFKSIIKGFGFMYLSVEKNNLIKTSLTELLEYPGPALLEVKLSPDVQVTPQVKFGKPNEDSSPLLDREEFLSNMIIKPLN